MTSGITLKDAAHHGVRLAKVQKYFNRIRSSAVRRQGGHGRISVFIFSPGTFLIEASPQPLFPTLCKPKTSGSAYFGKSRWDQTRRLSHGESVSAVPILLFSRGNGRAFPIDSGRVAIGAHVPRRREPLWHGAASENDLSSGLCARPNAQDTRRGSRIRRRSTRPAVGFL